MNRRKRRGLSLGTVVMLVLTVGVLAGFAALLPKFTGNTDVRLNASELAVAFDRSIAQLTGGGDVTGATSSVQGDPSITAVPPASLPTATPQPTQPPAVRFSLCAAGSIQINSSVRKALTDEGAYCFDILFDDLAGDLSADLSIATLENNVIASAKLTDANQPAELLAALRTTGVNALCLGYYGALDGGTAGLRETQQAVTDAGMTPYGIYADMEARERMTVIDVNGVQVALLSYQNELSSAGKKQTSTEERQYVYAAQQLPVIAADIEAVRARGAQVVVVSLCWGKAGATSPTGTQVELAQGIANAGADIILGTHPGALQSVKLLTAERGDGKYHPVLCAYSLGNLFSSDRQKRASLAGVLLKADVVYDPVTGCVAFDGLGYTPTYSWRDKEDGKTRYRTLLNDGQTFPSYVDRDQKNVMQRCYKLVTDVMDKSSIPLAQ